MLPTESPTNDATTFTTSLQNNSCQPLAFLAFTPGNAASIKRLESPKPIVEMYPRPKPRAPLTTASGAKTVKIPRPASAPRTPKIPKISAIQGVMPTKTSTILAGSGGSLRKTSSRDLTKLSKKNHLL